MESDPAIQAANDPAQGRPGPRVRPRWRRRLLAAALLLAALYLFRAPLLRLAARPLVADEPPAPAGYVLVLDGDRCYDRAAGLLRDGLAAEVLLVEGRPGRLERLGVRPPREQRARRLLAARGVPAEALTVIRSDGAGDWDAARRLRDWLHERPDAHVIALGDRFGSRRQRLILDAVLGPGLAGRVRLCALPQRSYTEADWWRHKEGLLAFFDAYLKLGHTWAFGEGTEPWREWDPDQYERDLR